MPRPSIAVPRRSSAFVYAHVSRSPRGRAIQLRRLRSVPGPTARPKRSVRTPRAGLALTKGRGVVSSEVMAGPDPQALVVQPDARAIPGGKRTARARFGSDHPRPAASRRSGPSAHQPGPPPARRDQGGRPCTERPRTSLDRAHRPGRWPPRARTLHVAGLAAPVRQARQIIAMEEDARTATGAAKRLA